MLSRQVLLILFSRTLTILVGYAGFFAIARYNAKDAYGMLNFALGLVGIFFGVTTLGFDAAHIKRLSEGYDQARGIGTFLLVKATLSFAFVAALAIAYFGWTVVLGEGLTDATTLGVLIVIAGSFLALAGRTFFDGTFRAHRRTVIIETGITVETAVTVAIFVTVSLVYQYLLGGWVPLPGWAKFWAGVLGYDTPFPIEEAALLLAFAIFIGNTAGMLTMAGFYIAHRYPLALPDKDSVKSYVRFATPLALIGVVWGAYTQTDMVFLGYFWQPADVADYRAATALLMPALVLSQAVFTLLFPTISSYGAHWDREVVVRLTRLAERYLSMLLLAVLPLLLVFAEEGFHVAASDEYLSAAPTLRILAINMFVLSLHTPMAALFAGVNKPGVLASSGMILAPIGVALNAIFIPESILGVPLFGWRAEGAALATVITMTGGYFYLKWRAHRAFGTRWIPAGFWRQALAATLTGGLLWLAKTNLPPTLFDRFFELAAVGVLGVLLYAGILFVLGGLTREDRALFRDALHPRRLFDHVRRELGSRPPTEDKRRD